MSYINSFESVLLVLIFLARQLERGLDTGCKAMYINIQAPSSPDKPALTDKQTSLRGDLILLHTNRKDAE